MKNLSMWGWLLKNCDFYDYFGILIAMKSVIYYSIVKLFVP